MDLDEMTFEAVCSECKETAEFSIIAVNPIGSGESAERVWECSNCGHEETEEFNLHNRG